MLGGLYASRHGLCPLRSQILLGGSWVVISGVISPLIWVMLTMIIVTLLVTPLITTHEPSSLPV